MGRAVLEFDDFVLVKAGARLHKTNLAFRKHIRHKEGLHYWGSRDGGDSIFYIRHKKGKEILGFIALEGSDYGPFYCPAVWVHPDYRRRGFCLTLHCIAAEFLGPFNTDDMRSPTYDQWLEKMAKKYPEDVIPGHINQHTDFVWDYSWELLETGL